MRLPRPATAVLAIITCLGVLASSLAVWASLTLFDTDRFKSLASETISQPEVTAALHEYLTSQIMLLVDADDRLSDVLPDQLAGLAPAIEGGINTVVSNAVDRLLESDRVQELLVDAIGRAHAALMRLLEGDGLTGDGITVAEGTVTFNALPVIDRGLHALQDAGIISEDRDLPTLSEGTEPSAQIEELADRFNVDLPDDFGQFALYSSERLRQRGEVLERAQQGLIAMKRAVVFLVVATVLLFGLVLLTAQDRRRTLGQLALGIAATWLLVWVAIDRLVSVIPARLAADATNRDAESATRSILETVTGQVRTMAVVFLIVAVVVVALSLLMGPSERATAVRARLDKVRTQPDGGSKRWIRDHVDIARIAVGAVCVLILVIGGLRWWSIIVALLLGGFGWVTTARIGSGEPEPEQIIPSG